MPPAKRKLSQQVNFPSKRLRVKNAAKDRSQSPPQLEAAAETKVISKEEPTALTFSLEEAKQHLMSADKRFEELFKSIPCKPFEELEAFHPFRALTTSILYANDLPDNLAANANARSQQISSKAALSIIHRFRCLFDPLLPIKPTSQVGTFPSPEEVANTAIGTLRSAGLSARKAEYVKDLASRFTDGRLSTERIFKANDEEMMEMLLEVRGIGKWTVDMFSIFHLRRPDILPVGDLGVQRGVLLWFLSRHTNEIAVNLPCNENSVVPTLECANNSDSEPLPIGLSVLKGRLKGKKVRGAFLTPSELEELTRCWQPYRSLGVYYMWLLAEQERKKN